MQLHEIRGTEKKKEKKRIGRGGKRGTYSGRGQKGQKARAGHRIRPAERDLIMRIPKFRGVKNRPKPKKKTITINVGDLERLIQGGEVTKVTLRNAGIFQEGAVVKILGGGAVHRAFAVKGIMVSLGARKKIESAGGSIHEKQREKTPKNA